MPEYQDSSHALGGSYEDNTYALGGPYEDNTVSIQDMGMHKGELEKITRLQKIKDQKLSSLNNQNPFASLDKSYTLMEDGTLESNQNKIWNELSDQEFQSSFQYGLDKYTLSRDQEGNWRMPSGELYSGDTRRLYTFGTKDLTNDNIKLGLARGDLDGSEARYVKWPSGELGVDTSDKSLDVMLPFSVATMLEGLAHGRKNAISNRVIKDRYSSPELVDAYGSGSSEYYTNREGLFGAPTVYEEGMGKQVFDNYFSDIQGRYIRNGVVDLDMAGNYLHEKELRRQAETMNGLDRVVNAGKAFARTFTKELFVDLADWTGEGLNSITGDSVGWDVGTEEEKTAMVNDWMGFNPYAAEEELNQAQAYSRKIVDAMFDENVDVDYSDVAHLVKIGITTPELLGDSVGFLATLFVPVLGWGGRVVNSANKVKGFEAAVKAKEITRAVADTKIAAERATVRLLDKTVRFTQKNAGLMQVSAGNVNDQIDAYRQEHGAAPSMYKVAQMFTTETLLLGIDKWADLSIIKAPLGLKGVRDAFTTITPEGKSKVLLKVASFLAGSASYMGKEALQEYTQEIGQAFNVKFNFDDNGGLFSVTGMQEAVSVLMTKEMQTTGILGAGLGAGGALQFQAVGGALPSVKKVAGVVSDFAKPLGSKEAASSAATNAISAPLTKEEELSTKQQYAKTLNQLVDDFDNGKVNKNTVSHYLDQIDFLNSTKHSLKGSPPEKILAGEEAYEKLLDQLELFVVENADKKLLKRVVRKTVQESITDNRAKEALEELPDSTKKVLGTFAKAIGDGEDKGFDSSVKAIERFFKKDNFKDTDSEEEAMAPILAELESALNGSVSETVEESFSGIKATLEKFQDTQTLEPPKSNDTVLGSGPFDEESEYDDESRKVDVERIANFVLGRDKKHNEAFMAKLFELARTNGVKEKTLNRIIKSYTSVEEEAVMGNRGYMSRIGRIKGLLESSNPDEARIKKEYTELSSMSDTIETSAIQLQKGIKAAKQKVAQYNKNNQYITGDKDSVKTEYVKDDGKKFLIYLKSVDGKWSATFKEAERLIELKTGYVQDIKDEMRAIYRRASTRAPGIINTADTFTVPVGVGTAKVQSVKDQSYFSNIGETLSKIGSALTFPNKVILGGKPTLKWKKGGDYTKANSLAINTKDFDKDDVVVVNDLRTFSIKGKDPKRPHLLPSLSSSKGDTLTDAEESFKQAIEAGATIVLDRDLLMGGNTKAVKEGAKAKKAFDNYLTQKGYVSLGVDGNAVFVKKTEANSEKVDELFETAKSANELRKEKIGNRASILSVERALKTGVDPIDGENLTTERTEELQKEYEELEPKVLKDSFDSDKGKLGRFLRDTPKKEVEAIGKEFLSEDSPSPINYEDKALETAVEAYIEAQLGSDVKGQEVVSAWKKMSEVDQLKGKELEKGISGLVKSLGVRTRQLVKNLLDPEMSFAAGKKDIWEKVYLKVSTNEIKIVVLRKPPTQEDIDVFESQEAVTVHKYTAVPLGIRRVTQDATKLVEVNRTTVLNSVPVESLPFSIRDMAKKFSDDIFKALSPVGEAELAEQTDSKTSKGKFVGQGFYLHNSPVRGIIFNKDGKPNPEVMAAVYLALGDLIKTDSHSMLAGYKSDEQIAAMFNVQPEGVTDPMRAFAKENGAFLKTVANKLGASVFKQLGITAKKGTDITSGEYANLVADMGNAAVAIAEVQGLFKATDDSSNKIAGLMRQGEKRAVKTRTHLVTINSKGVKEGNFINQVPNNDVEQFLDGFKAIAKDFPGTSTSNKGPSFSAPTQENTDEINEGIRNDTINLEIPGKAKTTMEILMTTPFQYNEGRVSRLLEAIDAEGSTIKEQLGYVDLKSAAYTSMYYKDQEVQKAVNRGVEKSIQDIRNLQELVAERGEADPSLYFEQSYIADYRYMMDSNTINPQTDKLQRFLFYPKASNLDYKVGIKENGGVTFETKDPNGKKVDGTYALRYSLAQALGKGVDKMSAKTIIDYTNVMLGLNEKQIETVYQALLKDGEFKFKHDEVVYEIKGKHISHALHALEFLQDVQKAGKDGVVTTSLSSEIDSLTNGFANKLQQTPILANDDMDTHLARIGILTKKFQLALKNNDNFIGPGKAFDPKLGHTMGDLFEASEGINFTDSYQNLAGITIGRLADGTVATAKLSRSSRGVSGIAMFEAVKTLLPGGESLVKGKAEGKIEDTIRELFKNPFMIFNYSASVGRIIKNLGFDVTHNVFQKLATTDLDAEGSETVKQAAEDLLASTYVISPDNKNTKIETPEQLQKALRTVKLKDIKIKPMKVLSVVKGKARQVRDLESAMSSIIENTYGSVVQEVFKEQFGPFIKMQDAVNDSFKIAFRIFDSKRMQILKKLRIENGNFALTIEDHAKVLEDLWDDFPWIVGPLTGAGTKKDVIGIITTSTKEPNEIQAARKKTQIELGTSFDKNNRTVTPLIRILEEAVSSGSVLPFHAMDGAEITHTINEMYDNFLMAAVLAVHDATVTSNTFMGILGFGYNKNMSIMHKGEGEKGYVLADALQGLSDRIKKTLDSDTFEKDYKDITAINLKVSKKDVKFPEAAQEVIKALDEQIAIVKTKRKEFYGQGGRLEGAIHGNMAGPPDSVYIDGDEEPNTDYQEIFTPLYKEESIESVEFDEVVEETSEVGDLDNSFNSMKKVEKEEVTRQLKALTNGEASIETVVSQLMTDYTAREDTITQLADMLEKRVVSLKNTISKENLENFVAALRDLEATTPDTSTTGIDADTKSAIKNESDAVDKGKFEDCDK